MTSRVNGIEDVRLALAKAVAGKQIPDGDVTKLANQIASAGQKIRGINICERGICIDYIVEGGSFRDALPDLLEVEGGRLQGIEIFPWGIINPDLFHIQVIQEFDELRTPGF